MCIRDRWSVAEYSIIGTEYIDSASTIIEGAVDAVEDIIVSPDSAICTENLGCRYYYSMYSFKIFNYG